MLDRGWKMGRKVYLMAFQKVLLDLSLNLWKEPRKMVLQDSLLVALKDWRGWLSSLFRVL
jgi:hypothetical protein